MRESIDQETARWIIEKSDRERAGFVHALYGKDVSDPRLADAVFDKGRQSLDEIIETVKQTLLARDKLKSDAAQRLLSMRAVSAKIKARLTMDPLLYVPILDVELPERSLCFGALSAIPINIGELLKLLGNWPEIYHSRSNSVIEPEHGSRLVKRFDAIFLLGSRLQFRGSCNLISNNLSDQYKYSYMNDPELKSVLSHNKDLIFNPAGARMKNDTFKKKRITTRGWFGVVRSLSLAG